MTDKVEYVIVDGGLVTEAPPRCEVLDLDVLSSQVIDEETIREVRDLMKRAGQFESTGWIVEMCRKWLADNEAPTVREWVVTGTCMTVEAKSAEEAIDVACDKIGRGWWHWEAEKVTDEQG